MTSSAAVEIRPHATKGRALHSTQLFQVGTTFASFEPLLQLPTLSRLSQVCTYCLKPDNLSACSRCHTAYYCNATCQALSWNSGHGKECKILQKTRARGQMPTPVRAVVLAFLVKEIGDGLEGLEGNVSAWRRGEEWRDMEMMAMGACSFAGRVTADEDVERALEMLCKIQTNAFHRFDDDSGVEEAIFIEPTLAMANHSCIPNTLVEFIGRKAVLRAARTIKPGDEIEISYIDYNHPLSQRRKALSSYNFTCQCPRCKDDLSVYQVCSMSPDLDLNRRGLVSDLSKLQRHPAVVDDRKRDLAKRYAEEVADLVDSTDMPVPLDERRATLQDQYRRCKSLIEEEFWAISPLPHVLTEISLYYTEAGSFAHALSVACLLATACDPYRFVEFFHLTRVADLSVIAKLLANIDTATLSESVKTQGSRGDIDQRLLETLQGIDLVTLCTMLLIMILQAAPKGVSGERDLSVSAMEMLEDIKQLPGREKETALIASWSRDLEDDFLRAFFEHAVLKQIETLASLGREVLRADFGY